MEWTIDIDRNGVWIKERFSNVWGHGRTLEEAISHMNVQFQRKLSEEELDSLVIALEL